MIQLAEIAVAEEWLGRAQRRMCMYFMCYASKRFIVFNTAIKRTPYNHSLYQSRAAVRIKLGSFSKAITDLECCEGLQPGLAYVCII